VRNWACHEERLAHALNLEGAEPAQGALADWFCAAAGQAEPVQARLRQGVALAAPRLHPTVLRHFLRELPSVGVPGGAWQGRCHPLATRYSVLLAPSLEAPRRQRRCPPDDSRRLVAQLLARLRECSQECSPQHSREHPREHSPQGPAEPMSAAQAWSAQQAQAAQTEFLAHCRGAQDALALLLGRRALRQAGYELSGDWDLALDHLQKAQEAELL